MNKIFALIAVLILFSSQAWAEPSDYARANVKCARAVEEAAVSEFKWTDSLFEMKFTFVLHDDATNFDTYATNKIRLQNEYGAWRRSICVCVWDAFLEKVKGVHCLKK